MTFTASVKDFFHRNTDALVATGIFLIAFFWKWPSLGLRDLSLDEPFTLFHAQKSLGEILRLSANGEPNPPLFMVLVHYWSLLVGTAEEHLRIIPLVFNALTASVLYLIGRKFFSVWAGILATGLFLFSNYYFYFATELRPYGLFSLATAGALYFFLHAEKSGSTKAFMGLLLCNVVLIYNHYFGWFVVGVEGFCTLLYLTNWQLFKRYLLVFAGTLFLFTPMLGVLLEQFSHSSEGTWVEPPGKGAFRMQLHALLNSGMVYRMMEFFIPIGLIAAFLVGKLFQTPKKYLIVLFWWLVPFTLMLALSDTIPMFVDRYLLYGSIGLFISIAAFVQRFAHFWWLQAITAGVLVFHMAGSFTSGKHYYTREIKSAVNQIKELKTADNLLVIYPEWTKLNFSYHFDIDLFTHPETLDENLRAQGIYAVWNADQAKHVADSLGVTEILFFTNMGPQAHNMEQFIQSMKENGEQLMRKDFPDNLIVAKFKK